MARSFKDFLSVDLYEVLNSHFDSVGDWVHEEDSEILYGKVRDIKVRIILSPYDYDGLNGFNVGFETQNEYDEWSSKINHVTTQFGAALIGAICQVLVEKLPHLEFDFLLFTSKDDINVRHRIYLRAIRMFIPKVSKPLGYREEFGPGWKAIIVSRKGVNTSLIKPSLEGY